MTDLQLFAFFILPVMVVAFGAIVYWVETRRWRTYLEPDLFDKVRSIANTEGLRKDSKTTKL